MMRIENDCVDCPKEIGCIETACPYKNVPHYYCDKCKEETDLFHFEDEQLCIDCIKKRLEKVVYEE